MNQRLSPRACAACLALLVASCTSSPAESVPDEPERLSWALQDGYVPSSVQVILDERLAAAGCDYEVDAETGMLRLLEDFDTSRNYYITYAMVADPAHPELTTGIAFGNHRDQALVRRLLGIAETAQAEPPAGMTIGRSATPTTDPAIFRVSRGLQAEGLRVAIASKSDPSQLDWLDSADFRYEAGAGEVTLGGGRAVDADTQFLFLSGQPSARNVFQLGEHAKNNKVRVVVNDRRLVEDVDFVVDKAAGTVTILDDAFRAGGAQYHVAAGNLAIGNHVGGDRLLELLRD